MADATSSPEDLDPKYQSASNGFDETVESFSTVEQEGEIQSFPVKI